jgi:phage-related protein
MKKSLAGFDEMNIITDTSSKGGGATSPTVDFSDIGKTDLSGIYKLTDKIKKIFDKVFTQIKENVMKVMLDLGFSQRFIDMWDMMVEGVRNIIKGLLDFIGGILGTIIALVTGDTEKVKENLTRMVRGIAEILSGLLSLIIGSLGMIVAGIIDTFLAMVNWIYNNVIRPIGEWFSSLWSGITYGFNTAINWIKDTFNSIVNFFRNIINNIVSLFKNIGTRVGNVVGSAFKTVVNGVLKAIESILNSPIKSINSLINTINKVPGINISKLPTFSLPRLAVGGVVNMPGRGINYGGANIGERGAEAVIPLTNSQMMAQLGEAIGKYVNINATVPVYVGNRQIAREIKKISADSDFAFNR